jgi:hypothetical protein
MATLRPAGERTPANERKRMPDKRRVQSDGTVTSEQDRAADKQGKGLQNRPHIKRDTQNQDVEPTG